MGETSTLGRKFLRDFVTDGVPSSGLNEPIKAEGRAAFDAADAAIELEIADRQAADEALSEEIDEVRDLIQSGTQPKASVRFKSDIAGTIATSYVAGTVHDGVTAVLGDRFIMDRSAGPHTTNGIYIVTAGTPTRSTDADTAAEIGRARAFVREGTDNGDTWFIIAQEAADITLDTTALTWLSDGTIVGTGVSFDDASQEIQTAAGNIRFSLDETDDGVYVEDEAGNRRELMTVGDPLLEETEESGFTEAEKAYVSARAALKRDELNSVNVSSLAGYVPGANLFEWTGQSFAAGDNVARLWASEDYIAAQGWQFNAWSISREYRTSGAAATYSFFEADTDLHPLVERGINGLTNIISDADIATGNYTSSARMGTPGPLAAYVFAELRRKWLLATADSTDRYQVHMNTAKTGANMATIGSGDELARAIDGMKKFKTYVEAQDGSAEPSLSGGESLNLAAIMLVQGQANDGSLDPWETQVQQYDNDLQAVAADTPVNGGWSQTARAPMFLFQTGNRNYGSLLMNSAKPAVDMMIDVTPGGDNFNKTIACDMWDGPSAGLLTNSHPDAGNWHPLLALNGKLGIMAGVAAFFMLVRREYWWIPFPYEVYYRGNRALVSIPCKFGSLREGPVTDGNIMRTLSDKGASFEDVIGGTKNTVISAEIVEGHEYLIEVVAAGPISDSLIFKLGDRISGSDQYIGMNNFRDSFTLDMALEFPFTSNQTIYQGGYVDSPATNDLGGFLEDIPEWVGPDVDLGLRAARYYTTALPMPSV